ncbi:MAG TPA: hypothetical protein VNQ56_17015 [Pseudolabrys sp.]|nr:hypothetical protein [Pseudolabrys sp.]
MRAIIRTAPAIIDHLPRTLTGLATKAESALRQIWRRLAHPYRPEQHYMRGPGPKSRAKDVAPAGRTDRARRRR